MYKTKTRPFASQPRQKKNRGYIHIRNLIRQQTPTFGGLFTTQSYVDGNDPWIDAFFLDHKGPNFFNLEIETTHHAYQLALWDHATEQACIRDDTIGFREHWKIKMQRAASTGEIYVHEKWTMHHDYCFGIGVHATIDAPALTIDALNDFIVRFLKTSAPYKNTVPLRYESADLQFFGFENASDFHTD